MNRNRGRGLAVLAILLVVFSVIAFVVPFAKTAVFWIGYVCGVFAILFQAYLFRSAFADSQARSRYYGFPIARIGLIYLAAQMAVSIVEFALAGIVPNWAALIINVLLLAFALIGCVAAETARDEVVRQEEQGRKRTDVMQEMRSLTAALVNQCADPDLKKTMTKLAEKFRYSDPVSSEKTAAMETAMKEQIEVIRKSLTAGETDKARQECEKLLQALNERNRVCKASK